MFLFIFTSCQLKNSSEKKNNIQIESDFNSLSNIYFAITKTEDKEYVDILRNLYLLLSVDASIEDKSIEIQRNIELYDDKYVDNIMETIFTVNCNEIQKETFDIEFVYNENAFYSFILFKDVDKDGKMSIKDDLYYYGVKNGKIFYTDEELEDSYSLLANQFISLDTIIDQIYTTYSNKISKIGIITAKDYQLYNNQWGRNHAKGSDLFQKITLESKNNPINCSWSWNWGSQYGEDWHVKAYPEINYGFSPWGHLVTKTDKLPKKIQEINKFTANFNAEFSNLTGKYNMAFEVWMAKNNPPKPSDISTEIMIWTEWDRNWDFWGNNVTDVIINGKEYFLNIAHADFHEHYEWKYICLRMKESQLSGNLDILPILQYLLQNDHIKENEYACNLEVGTEIVSGSGTFKLSDYFVTVE